MVLGGWYYTKYQGMWAEYITGRKDDDENCHSDTLDTRLHKYIILTHTT